MSELLNIIGHTGSQGERIDQGNAKPLVTFVLVAYNQEKFIRQAIESALAQTYRPIQFIFSDDCSTDHTFEIMCESAAQYEGKENILLNHNEKNLGVVDHLNKIFIELAEGKYLVPLAGDDITSPDRTEKVVSILETTGASAVAINPVMIDENGQSEGKRFFAHFPSGVLHFQEYFVKEAPFFAGGGYTRDLFDVYGPMKNSARNEDRILPCRASTLGGIAYLNDLVYFYREHSKNMSFWIKMKRDPKNSRHYEELSRKNDLQNLENFFQEVSESYCGHDKQQLLEQIDARSKLNHLELDLITARVPQRLRPVFVAYRTGKSFKEVTSLLLVSISPRLYKLLLVIRLAFR